MPECRFFLDSVLTEQEKVSIQNEEMRHLLVMRPQINDSIELVNGKGSLAKGHITSIHKKEVIISLDEVKTELEPSFKLIIAQGLPKAFRLDYILEKGTELGMTELWLFPGDKSEKIGISENQSERMQKILISSMKQCGRLFLPKIQTMPPISKWKPFSYPLFYGGFSSIPCSFFSSWQNIMPKSGAIFVVGPESGLTQLEENYLDQLMGHKVSLHKNILRTDTASITALALMSHFDSSAKDSM